MPLIGLYALTAVGAGLALFAPLELAFGALLGAWLLVPAGLILPGFLHVLLIDRIVLIAFVVRLVARSGRPGEPGRGAYRLTAVHGAWGLLLLVGYVDGVLLAPGSVHDNLIDWLTVVDTAVFLVVALAVLRTIGVLRGLRPLAAVVAVASGIGIIERLSGHGWASYLQESIPVAYRSSFVFGLKSRGGAVRAQGAAEFALEYGWILAILLPLLAVAVGAWITHNRGWRWRRHLLLVLPVAAVVALAFSSSRSAEVAVALGAVLLVVAAGAPRRLTAGVLVALGVVVLVGVADPHFITSPFAAAAHSFSVDSRIQRLPDFAALAAHRPFVGQGYTGYTSLVIGADNGYVLTYGQLGVIGLVGWIAVLVTTLAVAVRCLWAPRNGLRRELAAATVVGVVAVVVAAGAYDLTFTEQSMWVLALLGALSATLADAIPARRWAPSPSLALLPLAGVVVGLFLLATSTVGWSRTYLVYVISQKELAGATGVNGLVADDLSGTVCGYLTIPSLHLPDTTLRCTQPSKVEQSVYEAEVSVRIGGANAAAVDDSARLAFAAFRGLGYPTVTPTGPVESGKPAWAVTAPLWGGVAGLGLALVVPPLPYRRRSASALRPATA